jgi:hypothetical protein
MALLSLLLRCRSRYIYDPPTRRIVSESRSNIFGCAQIASPPPRPPGRRAIEIPVDVTGDRVNPSARSIIGVRLLCERNAVPSRHRSIVSSRTCASTRARYYRRADKSRMNGGRHRRRAL